MVDTASNFAGTIPEYYDSFLGPALFEKFGVDLAQRLPARPPGDVLEIACGTGIVTRLLRERLDPALRLVASDISKPMLDYARARLAGLQGIDWREADAAALPFGDGEFGAVVCAFGVMFAPERRAVFSEMRRVLGESGILLFNVWDRMEENPHAEIATQVLESLFPGDPEITFTLPFEMHDPALLRELLAEARFREVRIEKKRIRIDGISARNVALGSIRGTPRALLIEKRGVALEDVVEKVAAALARHGGVDPFRAPASAVVVEARAAG
jgi:ubiquinone/menaquinone biosynthesis C-methylase UbiE